LNRLLVGDNAFIGVSHLSHAHARQKVQQLRLETIVEVIKKAISSGATGFAFTVHPTNFQILSALEAAGVLGPSFEICPVLPYAAGYVRTVNEKGMSGLVNDVVSRLSLQDKARALLRGTVSAFTSDPVGMLKAYIDMELASIRRLKGANLASVFLHEVVTDLGLSFQSKELFHEYTRHVRDAYNATPGFVTRNFVRFVRFFDQAGLSPSNILVMTPVNRIGFQMTPSREACEDCLTRLTSSNVIAMSILAGGYLGLDEAVEYVRHLQNLSGIVIGVSSMAHAEQSFTRLKSLTAA
jgi:hypothetical protein